MLYRKLFNKTLRFMQDHFVFNLILFTVVGLLLDLEDHI